MGSVRSFSQLMVPVIAVNNVVLDAQVSIRHVDDDRFRRAACKYVARFEGISPRSPTQHADDHEREDYRIVFRLIHRISLHCHSHESFHETNLSALYFSMSITFGY
jgi:hypothetical protein